MQWTKIVITASALIVGCSKDSVTGPKDSATVTASGTSFSPALVTIKPGGTVTWKFQSGGPYNVTFDSESPAEGGIADMSTGSVSRVFAVTGTFNYHCTNHAGMSGSVYVQAPSGGGY